MLDVLLQGLSRLLLNAAQVTHDRRTVASALEVGDETGAYLVPRADRVGTQVQELGASTILERHGKPVRHDLFVVVGRLNAQLVELQEHNGVRGAVIAWRQVWLELAGPDDAVQLGSEGTATCCGHRSPSRRQA